MSERPPPPLRPPPRSGFRPEFTLLLLYFFAFFVFFCLVLALPDLLDGLHSLPPAASIEEERAAGARIAERAIEGRLGLALLATALTLAIGTYARVLPGLRRRG